MRRHEALHQVISAHVDILVEALSRREQQHAMPGAEARAKIFGLHRALLCLVWHRLRSQGKGACETYLRLASSAAISGIARRRPAPLPSPNGEAHAARERARKRALSSILRKTSRPRSGKIEAIGVHHLRPRRHEVVDKLRFRIVGAVDLGKGAQLGVRTE